MRIERAMETSYYPVYGETLKIREIAGLVLSETRYRPQLSIPHHKHEEDAYFNLVLEGGYRERSGGREREFVQSTLVFHPDGEAHSDQFHQRPTRLFNIRFAAQRLDGLRAQAELLTASARFDCGLVNHLAVRLYREFREMDSLSSLIIEGLALEMLGEASRCSKANARRSPPRWLLQVREHLHACFAESLMLARIAESAGVHPVHLNRAFRQYFRCTIGEYVRGLRVQYACHRLSTSQASLIEIALAAGFSDQGHFSRTFKRHTGLTPARYRATFTAR